VDAWLKQLWDFVQRDPQYRNKTTIFFTVDHGRGDVKKEEWTSHNNKIAGASQIWFAVIGPGTRPLGEIKSKVQLYQKQFAQTIARLMGHTFTASHPIADPILSVFE
jgi:hypothetical protein